MKTFLSWLIANLEIAGVFILLPFQWLFIQNHHLDAGMDTWKAMALGSLLIAFLGANPTKSVSGDLLNIILTIGGGILLAIAALNGYPDAPLIPFIIIGVTGLAVGIATAVFAVANFYELVSLRWIYSNSNASKFEISATYGFSRFAIGFHLGVYAAGLLI